MVPVAQLASFWNKPIIGWVSTNKELDNKNVHSTLVRTLGPVYKISVLLKEMFKKYNWRMCALISTKTDGSRSIRDAIIEEFFTSSIDIVELLEVNEQEEEKAIKRAYHKIKSEARSRPL